MLSLKSIRSTYSNTLGQVINEIQDLSSRFSFIEGTKDAILSIKKKLEDHLKTLESQLDASSKMKELLMSVEQTISKFNIP